MHSLIRITHRHLQVSRKHLLSWAFHQMHLRDSILVSECEFESEGETGVQLAYLATSAVTLCCQPVGHL